MGTDPLLITYGHGMGPVEPPGFRLEREEGIRREWILFRKKDGPEPFETRKKRLKDPREIRDLPFANLKV